MMRKIFLFCLVVLISLGASAQRRRRVKRPPTPTPEELAEQARKENYDRKLKVIERVTFVDSVLLKKSDVLEALSLGSENGSVHAYNNFFQQKEPDTLDCALFQSQLKDKIVYAQPGRDSLLHLFASEMIAGKWTEPALLPGLQDTVDYNYPFMLSDGVTLYYSAKTADGLGGYDIHMTRWDADEQKFLKPENIGMPFNSPANDYLYVLDEFNQLGWFVTDRACSGDTVCLYCFVPNDVRRIYNANEMGRDTLVALANINSIKDSWTDVSVVEDALQRLSTFKTQVKKSRKADFRFIVNDKIIYTCLSQFRHKESIRLAQQWMAQIKEKNEILGKLDDMRKIFSTTDAAAKAELAPRIQKLEQRYELLLPAIKTLEKEIRTFEQR